MQLLRVVVVRVLQYEKRHEYNHRRDRTPHQRTYEEGIVTMFMSGSCSGCASSTLTLKNGIEGMLKHYIPEVIRVEGVDDENSEVAPYYT